MAGRQVYLYITDDVIRQLAAGLGVSPGNFFEALKTGPSGITASGICQKALHTADDWRSRGYRFPPYLGYLSLFVVAAGAEGDFASHAYYPRLRRLLGLPDGSMLPSFERMLTLWDDLERWSKEDKKGGLGVFVARFVGKWIHVGVPLAQSLLSVQERKDLPSIFSAAGLDPGSMLADSVLRKAVQAHGADYLRPRTLALLSDRAEGDLCDFLI